MPYFISNVVSLYTFYAMPSSGKLRMVPISKAQQIDKRAFQFAKRGTA